MLDYRASFSKALQHLNKLQKTGRRAIHAATFHEDPKVKNIW